MRRNVLRKSLPQPNLTINIGEGISGSGIIHSEKGDFEINEGDSYSLKQGEKYYIEGDKLLLSLINAPKWTPEQQKVVD